MQPKTPPKFKKDFKYLIVFLLVTGLFIIGSFYLPHNFRGLIFYGILFLIDWLIMRVVFPKLNIKDKWKIPVFVIHWMPIVLLSSIVLFGIFIPFPTWASLLKKIIILLTISGVVAQIALFIFVLIYLLLRMFLSDSKPLRYILYVGLGFMTLFFGLFITSPLWTLSPKVSHVNISIKNLPPSFENYKIIQISDLHLDYASRQFIQKSVEKMNAENPDLVVMTGDMVTFCTQEMNPFMQHFQQIKAKDGIFCIMGNHDYGNYAFEFASEEYDENLEELRKNYQSLHWRLLNNEFEYIVKNADTLVIAGTENQSLNKMFQSYGDIDKTLKGISAAHPIILLTHDPNYWVQELCDRKENIALTLSGHTHGLQIGMDTKWCRWSLYQLIMSDFWGGLYEKNGKYLYINLGLGQTAYPGRIGLKPEITVLTLNSL